MIPTKVLRWFRTMTWFEFAILLILIPVSVNNVVTGWWAGFILNAVTFGIIHAVIHFRMRIIDNLNAQDEESK